MDNTSVSIRLDSRLVAKVDLFAKQRNLTRSKAIALMLENTKIVILSEGTEILKLLHLLYSKEDYTKGTLEELWQLLNSITEKVQQTSAE